MRIVGGKYKGRVLSAFDGYDIRPTSDKVRESLFNILQFNIPSAKFLDLFAGTGAIGIEALSRNAEWVTFNDLSRTSLDLLRKNLKKLQIEEKYNISFSDAVRFLQTTSDKFDIVFIDPPYKSQLGIKALGIVERVLSEKGKVIFEDEKVFDEKLMTDKKLSDNEKSLADDGKIKGLKITDRRKYGRVHLTFFERA